ncbi:MAG: Na+/H+ antiporter NhaA [Coriobacteriia bacterium]|nr:Na+/H+ antiporter NhaA [Coriobacteriia bacterium]
MSRRSGLLGGFADFLKLEISGSVFLLGATVLALVIANSPAHEAFEAFLHVEFGVEFGSWSFIQSMKHWIDDGLMAVFFFVIGLEVKREMVVGELSKPRQAILPVLAALGGMLVPAAIYLAINAGGPGGQGWGIPMATDIAFALGVLAVLGSRVPASLKLFLTALAIADDIGAILVIAIFYSRGLSLWWLAVGFVLLGVLLALNRLRVDATLPYALIGFAVWFCFLNSGVHATIAGVLVALTIPARAKMSPLAFVDYSRHRLAAIESADTPGAHVLDDNEQQECAFEIGQRTAWVASPLQRMEHSLHPLTTYVVLPLFALANANLRLVGLDVGALLIQPVTLGVFLGLALGKPLGISLFAWVAVKSRLTELPSGLTWRHVIGGGILGGIGFTMSLFVANLAFSEKLLLDEAKMAVLLTSILVGIGGYLFLRGSTEATE